MSTMFHLGRAQILMEQGRYDLAAQELQQEIGVNPDNAYAFALLALCQSHLKQFREATEAAGQAIHLAPDFPYAHYVYGHILDDVGRYKEAELAARETVRLDPEHADYFALLSQVLAHRSKWAEAVQAAEMGLAIDSEHAACGNLRAHALVKLRRPDEASGVIAGNLARDPENAYTHATLGWSLLEQGQHKEAMNHFREALRLNPEMEWARAGIVEALKARNPIYRLFLGYVFWMSRLNDQKKSGVILGAYILFQGARVLSASSPQLRPILLPVIIAYIAFAYLTWTSQPLFNLLLRLDPFGRMALTRRQVVASNWFGLCILIALGFLGGWLYTHWEGMALEALGFLCLSVPVSVFFRTTTGRSRSYYSVIYAIIAGGFGLLLILQGFGIGGNIL